MKGNQIPVLNILLLFFCDLHPLFRIIDQCRQPPLVPAADRIPKLFIDLLSHGSGAVFQHMVELLIFPMNIREKMLRTLRQIHDRLQIDDLRGCRSQIPVLLCQHLQNLAVLPLHIRTSRSPFLSRLLPLFPEAVFSGPLPYSCPALSRPAHWDSPHGFCHVPCIHHLLAHSAIIFHGSGPWPYNGQLSPGYPSPCRILCQKRHGSTSHRLPWQI